jgi:pSer/pThr/pTyr-binding forkhead associated (FHA) protein
MKVKVFHSDTQTQIKEFNITHLIREGESCFIGRSQHSGLSLDSPSVSRMHGKFCHRDGQYYFCDLGSSNGSVIKGGMAEVNQEYLLQPGDVIRVGDFVLLLEELPEVPEELSPTVMGNVDATVMSGYTDLNTDLNVEFPNLAEDKQVIEAELVNQESSALVKLADLEADYNLQQQTKALFAAINQRILAELRAAGHLTRDTYLKAVRKARTSIEQERLIDPDQFEKEAEQYWQSVAKSTSELSARIGVAAAKSASHLGQRLGAAAKAAWNEFLSHQPDLSQQSEISEVSTSDASGSEPTPNPSPEGKALSQQSENSEVSGSSSEPAPGSFSQEGNL